MLNRISSNKLPKAVGSYSAATKIDNLIFTSGQLPINGKLNIIEYPNDIKKQTEQSMNNIKSILEDNGSCISKIIKTTVYLKNINDFSSFDEVYKDFFDKEFPSRTAFEVGHLPMDSLIEIEVIAEV